MALAHQKKSILDLSGTDILEGEAPSLDHPGTDTLEDGVPDDHTCFSGISEIIHYEERYCCW